MTDLFTDDMGFPEGPVRLHDGSFLFVEMAPDKGCVTKVEADGKTKTIIAKTGRPNGLAVDRRGAVWVAETAQRALLRLNLDGKYEKVAQEFDGEPFLFLNDVAVGPDGCIYLTDSGIEMEVVAPKGDLAANFRDLDYDGRVFRVDQKSGEVRCIDRGIKFANGLAFSPAGDLFVNETLTGAVYRYRSENGEVSGGRELFGNVIENFNEAELKGPDGMKFAADGSLYVCVFGQGDVTVLDPEGSVMRRIRTCGVMPTNLAFGAPGEKTIYVTEAESGCVQKIEVGVDGLPLHA